MKNNTIFLATYAKLPHDIATYNLYKNVGVYVEVDLETGVMIDVDVSLYSDVSMNFLRKILRGTNIIYDRDIIVGEIEKRYWGSAKKAILTAVRRIFDKYDEVAKILKKDFTPEPNERL